MDQQAARTNSSANLEVAPFSGVAWHGNWGAGVLLLAASAAAWFAFNQKSIVRYTTAAVTSGAVSRAVTATGTVDPVLTIIVGTYVCGVIQQLHCDYNTEVKAGQICAKNDPHTNQATVDEDKANLDGAEAQH